MIYEKINLVSQNKFCSLKYDVGTANDMQYNIGFF